MYFNDSLDDPLVFDGSNVITGCASAPAPDAIENTLASGMLNMAVDKVGNVVTRAGVIHQGRPNQGQICRAFAFFECQGNPQLVAVAGGAFRFKCNQKLPVWEQMTYPSSGLTEAPYYPPKVFGTGPETVPPPPPDDEVTLCGFTSTEVEQVTPVLAYYGFSAKPAGYKWGHACLRRFGFCYNGGPDHVRTLNSLFALNSSMNPIGNELLDHYLLGDSTFASQLLAIAESISDPLPDDFYLEVAVEFDRPQERSTYAFYGTEAHSRWRIRVATMRY